MKTYTQFCEDLDKRRIQLAKRQKEGVTAFNKKVSAKTTSFRERLAKRREREELKKEIKRELQTEQTPTMQPNEINKLIARRQATQKVAHMKHVHQELGAEARAQQAAKRAEMKAIMSR